MFFACWKSFSPMLVCFHSCRLFWFNLRCSLLGSSSQPCGQIPVMNLEPIPNQVRWFGSSFYVLDRSKSDFSSSTQVFLPKVWGWQSYKWSLLIIHNPIPFVEAINFINACQPLGEVWLQPRLGRAANDLQHRQQVAFYVSSAKRRMSLQAAAQAWANGMPWAMALKLCTRVIKRADARAKAIPKRRASWWFCMLQSRTSKNYTAAVPFRGLFSGGVMDSNEILAIPEKSAFSSGVQANPGLDTMVGMRIRSSRIG